MDLKTLLMLGSALVILMLGLAHLVFTFWGPKLVPRDTALIDAMQAVSPIISSETTMWKAWVGFNASHSMGAILFGLMFGYLAVFQPAVLFGSVFLQAVGLLMLAGYLLLAYRYWFSVPFAGICIALICFLSSVVWAYAQGIGNLK